jgi:Tol biopolymer transport system component
MDREGSELDVVGEPGHFSGNVSLSPDSRLAAVTIEDTRLGTDDIWLYDLEAGTRSRFTFDPADDDRPIWSPDGESIVFQSMREGVYDLYIKSISGSESERVLLATDKDKEPWDWSDDNRHLLFETEGDIWVLPLDPQGEPERVLETEPFNTALYLSPDGRWILYSEFEGGRMETFITSFENPGRRWQVSTQGGVPMGWRADGKEIAYSWINGATFVEVASDGDSPRLLSEDRPGSSGTSISAASLTSDFKRALAISDAGTGQAVPLVLVQNWPLDLER